MKPLFLICSLSLFGPFLLLYGQQNLNLTLLDQRNDFADLEYADIWGYTHPDGTEYAAVGTRQGVAIYRIGQDGKLKLIQHIRGDYSPWRDIKSYGNYIYAIDDSGNDGLMIINMAQAPRNITWSFWRPELIIGNERKFLDNCHNLWMDEEGVLYLSGCNLNKGGVLMADVSANPIEPAFLAAADPVYSHDCFARNDRLWSANVYDGTFTVYDISDKRHPILLARQKTGGKFTHNVWLSDDDRYLFTTDEVANAAVEVYDVQDLSKIKFLDAYRPAASLGSGVIPHNVHYYRGWLVISHYTDGVKVVDANRPDNLVEVGAFDTWPGANGGYHGCWGAFPFLPSGRLLASNIEDGLYLLQPNYQRACYLEGKITDAVTGARINNVKITIRSAQANIAYSDLNGLYRTGQYPSGSFTVEYIKEGYQKGTATAKLINGQVTLLDIQLFPLKSYTVQGRVLDAVSGQIIPNARVVLRNDLSYFETQANDRGQFSLPRVYTEDYEVFAAAWGYRYLQLDNLNINSAGPYDLEMKRGYQDDFLFDLGWISESDPTVTAGFWQWGEPKGTTDSGTAANPYDDLPNDFGDFCYVTGNGGGTSTRDDVDNGLVRLTSPPMDLRIYQDPLLTYYLWFFNSLNRGDDTLKVFLSNGREKILIEQLTNPVSGWREQSRIQVRDFLPVSAKMYLILETADQPDRDHIVEAAIDGFEIMENGEATPVRETTTPQLVNFRIFPNPADGPISLEFDLARQVQSLEVRLLNSTGQVIFRQMLFPAMSGNTSLPAPSAPGLYFLQFCIDGRTVQTRKVIWKQ